MKALVVAVAYLLGTVPTALVVGRRLGRDPTREGSGNPGASNVYRTAGPRAGAVVFAGDLLKGIAATGLGLAAGGRLLGLACGAAAVVGHVLPVTRRLRGGKGVATASGLVVVLDPLLAAVVGLGWLVLARVSGTASLASLAAAALLPAGFALRGRPLAEVVGLAAVAAVVVARHAGNIGRLVRGDERTLRR
ncbi:MAG TPA: glycerol-3-phosphate acyltransferase [Acidimicrobiales bacterium]|nr:glycerol-3-phosphate acyltransferase [Acidimicrobiales bacterium]